jgi:TPR repeat protein
MSAREFVEDENLGPMTRKLAKAYADAKHPLAQIRYAEVLLVESARNLRKAKTAEEREFRQVLLDSATREAERYLKSAAKFDEGKKQSNYYLGMMYSDPSLFRSKANSVIGMMVGRSPQTDRTISFRCFLQAAKHDHVTAMRIVAARFRDGYGVRMSSKSAIEWFEKAKKKGDKRSAAALVKMTKAADSPKPRTSSRPKGGLTGAASQQAARAY